MAYEVHDIEIAEGLPPRLVLNYKPGRRGLTTREEAIQAAAHDAALIGWNSVRVTRAARTPSGGWSISLERL